MSTAALRIVFAGSGEFGVPTLRTLCESGHQVAQVISQPDRPSGRGRKLTPTPIAQFAIERGLTLLRTGNINTETIPPADLTVVIAFGQKIAPHVVNHPRLGSINLHASLLPKYRGAAPINWAIINGETETGNSVIRLAQKMDAGPILGQSRLTIGETETAGELHDRLSEDGPGVVLATIESLAAGTVREIAQDEPKASLAPKMSRESATLDWSHSAASIANRIRGMHPWPGCHARLVASDGTELARATLVRARRTAERSSEMGVISDAGTIGCGDGALEILELQPEGKRAMPLMDYRRGYSWPAGGAIGIGRMKARDYALIQLARITLPGWKRETPRFWVHDARPPTDPRDFALAEQIVIGVTKNLLLLQWLTVHYSGKRLKQIDPLVQRILAIALYQLRFLNRIPASAAVNEAVAQAKRFGRKSAAGFINAVLRNATREPDPPMPEAQVALSHPPELFDRLVALVGMDEALAICRHNNAEPPTIVRLSAGANVAQLHTEGITITPHERPGMFVVDPTKISVLSDWSKRGLAQVQDPTAAAVADDCDVHPGQTILDRCAGMGTKTLQLHERLAGSGKVVAIDASQPRVAMLQRVIAERALSNIDAIHASFLRDIRATIPQTLDRILVDAPCSNSGVLARRPEARYRQDDKSLRSLEKLQLDILEDTAPYVAPGGLLIYSTCSIWASENQLLVDGFLQTHTQFTRLYDRATLPGTDRSPQRYHDGGYVAVMRLRTA